MKHFGLFYNYVPDIRERRAPFRAAHLAHAQAAAARGELLAGGAFVGSPAQGLFTFKCANRAIVEAFAAADPYVINNLVPAWRVREWLTCAGEEPLARALMAGSGPQ